MWCAPSHLSMKRPVVYFKQICSLGNYETCASHFPDAQAYGSGFGML